MKFVVILLCVGTALIIGQAEGVTEFPCTFPEEWRGNEFSIYRGSPPIFSSIWYFEDNGVEFEADGDPAYCYQITDQFYIIRYGQDLFKCLTIDYTPGGKTLTIGNKGNPQTVNQVQPGAFDDTAVCSLCAERTNEFQIAIAEVPAEIVPPKCDVPHFCTPEAGTICESPITTTKAPITSKKEEIMC
ncbi:unnamed protein product [Mytilus edulis]|uniref:Uncharacterized protein n=1 Tax=Mytilus edulis TaxID=6550 RepID=A0A8S3SR74_MYTED|nr:unnamed protein product [Mytilus edulis]